MKQAYTGNSHPFEWPHTKNINAAVFGDAFAYL